MATRAPFEDNNDDDREYTDDNDDNNFDADNCHGRKRAGDVQQHLPKTTGNLYFMLNLLVKLYLLQYLFISSNKYPGVSQ